MLLCNRQERNISRGQALVETALVMTLLIAVVASIAEFGLMFSSYMSFQDAARNSARFSSDSLYNYRDNIHNCKLTEDFYRQTACLVHMELAQARPEVSLNYTTTDSTDDILISAFSIAGSGMVITPTVVKRYPTEDGESGWSFAQDWYGMRHQNSRITSSDITQKLNGQAPSTGILLVEIFGHYDQKLKLPWITAFLPDPYILYTYTIMPLASAEPQSPYP